MKSFDDLLQIVARLRAPDGCPWDRAQTHETLKAPCIEEAAEVVCGINMLSQTGSADNLKEELGDLLLQVLMHAQIAQEEGLFTMEDVVRGITDKMIRRHPHVFGDETARTPEEALAGWEAVKAREKKDETQVRRFLLPAFEESRALIDRAMKRKGF